MDLVSEKEIIEHMTKSNVVLTQLSDDTKEIKMCVRKLEDVIPSLVTKKQMDESISKKIEGYITACPGHMSVWPNTAYGWAKLIIIIITIITGLTGGSLVLANGSELEPEYNEYSDVQDATEIIKGE